jgi:hypothetical protein
MGATFGRGTVAVAVVVLGPILLGRPARAADTQTAEALFQTAREAMARGELDQACPLFAESERLDPAPGTLLNLAECEERSGRLASALAHFEEGHDALPPGDYRLPFSLDKITKLNRRVPRLTLRAAGPVIAGVTVFRDDTELGAASLGVPLPVDPGAHVCVLRVPGRADSRAEVRLAEGDTRTLELAPGPPLDTIAADAAARAAQRSRQRTWALVTGGAGLAGLVLGGVFGIASKLEYDSARSGCHGGASNACPGPSVAEGHTAYTEATVADVGFIGGGALLAAGVVVYLTAPKARTVTVGPGIEPGAAGLRLSGTW